MSSSSRPDSEVLKALTEAQSLADCIGYNDIWARPHQVQGLLHGMMMARAATALQHEDVGSQAAGPIVTDDVLENGSLADAGNMATCQLASGAPSTPTVSSTCGGAGDGAANGSKAKQKGKRSSSSASKKRMEVAMDKKPNAVLEWTNVMVHDLMSLRYETHAARFSKAKNNAALKEAWLLLATELSTNQGIAISSEQCKNKLKWLKRKWAEYNADVRATGNSEVEVLEPPGLAQMQEFWSGSSGMNGQTLADSEADGTILQSDNEASGEDEAAEPSRENKGGKDKRRKTMGDSFEIGMQSIAEGFQAMAAAMTPTSTSTDTPGNRSVVELMDARFDAMMQRQDEQLAQMQLQQQQLAALIATMQRGNSN